MRSSHHCSNSSDSVHVGSMHSSAPMLTSCALHPLAWSPDLDSAWNSNVQIIVLVSSTNCECHEVCREAWDGRKAAIRDDMVAHRKSTSPQWGRRRSDVFHCQANRAHSWTCGDALSLRSRPDAAVGVGRSFGCNVCGLWGRVLGTRCAAEGSRSVRWEIFLGTCSWNLYKYAILIGVVKVAIKLKS